MIQDIITYMILGSAITLAVIKVRNKFWRKRKKKAELNSNNKSSQSNCSACVAECVMRDVSTQSNQYNKDLCNEIEAKSN
ncbi:MAG: hypothetical protein L3J54_10385 [Draconibacterium sp.]|nr:hypothetical protein [Draconibacterium sp.]